MFQKTQSISCFNTQPPEGGWREATQAVAKWTKVSTHSRLKAAGFQSIQLVRQFFVSTHSRLKAAGSFWPHILFF